VRASSATHTCDVTLVLCTVMISAADSFRRMPERATVTQHSAFSLNIFVNQVIYLLYSQCCFLNDRLSSCYSLPLFCCFSAVARHTASPAAALRTAVHLDGNSGNALCSVLISPVMRLSLTVTFVGTKNVTNILSAVNFRTFRPVCVFSHIASKRVLCLFSSSLNIWKASPGNFIA